MHTMMKKRGCAKRNRTHIVRNCEIRQKAYLERRSKSSCDPHPAGADELGELPESASTMEHIMRNLTSIILPILIAASISGMMFTATLA